METTIIVNRVAFQNIVLQISEQILSLAFPTLIITKADNILAFSAIFQKKAHFPAIPAFPASMATLYTVISFERNIYLK